MASNHPYISTDEDNSEFTATLARVQTNAHDKNDEDPEIISRISPPMTPTPVDPHVSTESPDRIHDSSKNGTWRKMSERPRNSSPDNFVSERPRNFHTSRSRPIKVLCTPRRLDFSRQSAFQPYPSRLSERPRAQPPPKFYRYQHRNSFAVLCLRSDGFTITNGYVCKSGDGSIANQVLFEKLSHMNATTLVLPDYTTQKLWIDILNTWPKYHPAHDIKTITLDTLPEPPIGMCESCGREECHRWIAVVGGISRYLNMYFKPIYH